MSVSSQVDIKKLSKMSILRPAQREQVQRSIRTLKRQIGGLSSYEGATPVDRVGDAIDVDVAVETLQRTEKMLQRGTAPELSVAQKRKLYRASEDLMNEIKNGMPSHEQMERPTAQNMDAHMAWERHNKKKINAWKTMRRLIEPDNTEPNFTNVEILRPTQPSYRDLAQYWANFPDFEDETLAELDELDEETVMQVAMYCVAGWAEKNIQRKLGITKDQYRAALQRIKQMQEEPDDEDEPEDNDVTALVLSDDPARDVLSPEAMTETPVEKAESVAARPSDCIMQIVMAAGVPLSKDAIIEMMLERGFKKNQVGPPLSSLVNQGKLAEVDGNYSVAE